MWNVDNILNIMNKYYLIYNNIQYINNIENIITEIFFKFSHEFFQRKKI